jgi:hypothetical protein
LDGLEFRIGIEAQYQQAFIPRLSSHSQYGAEPLGIGRHSSPRVFLTLPLLPADGPASCASLHLSPAAGERCCPPPFSGGQRAAPPSASLRRPASRAALPLPPAMSRAALVSLQRRAASRSPPSLRRQRRPARGSPEQMRARGSPELMRARLGGAAAQEVRPEWRGRPSPASWGGAVELRRGAGGSGEHRLQCGRGGEEAMKMVKIKCHGMTSKHELVLTNFFDSF